MVVAVDIETSSACSLRDCGAWVYSLHPSTRVYVVSFGAGREFGVYRFATLIGDGSGEPLELPQVLADYVRSGKPLVAFNVGFERSVWRNVLAPRWGWPDVADDQWRDAQTIGCAYNLPPTLEGLAAVTGTPAQKDTVGAKLMRSMASAVGPKGGPWTYPNVTTENLATLGRYCEGDVRATLDVWFKLPPLSAAETLTERVDSLVNARGVFLDQEFAAKLARFAKRRQQVLEGETFETTFGELASSIATPSLKAWLEASGVELPTMARKKADGSFRSSPTINRSATQKLLKDSALDESVRRVLNNRLEASKATSLAKLRRVASMVGPDGRLRNALLYCGAHTGRWTSYGLQIHNLPKDNLTAEASGVARALVEASDANDVLADVLGFLEDRPLEVLSQLLRSVVAAPPGRELIAGDFSAIEARVLPWLAGQNDVVEFFANFDRERVAFQRGERETKPTDLYEFTAAKIGSTSRQLGKIAALALGYGMGALKFAKTAAMRGVVLEPLEARSVQREWRKANDVTVDFWGELENAVRSALDDPGGTYDAGRISAELTRSRDCLWLLLPSGRAIRYWRPRIVRTRKVVETIDDAGNVVENEFETDEIRYFTVSKTKRSMSIESTYGGKLAENVTQAVARDLLAEVLPRIEYTDPYDVVMHVHDSIASEVPAGAGTVEEFRELMVRRPSWARTLPVAADCYRARRFRG